MDQSIQDFIGCKRLSVVGVSRGGKKFGNTAYKELKTCGYQVYIVHPDAKEIDGEICYPDLKSLQGKVDGVLVSVPPKQGMEVLRQAAAIGVGNVWIQQQGQSPELIALGRELNLKLVHGKCILLYTQPVRSYHAWHRAFVKVFGKL